MIELKGKKGSEVAMQLDIPKDLEKLLTEISKKFSLDPSDMALKALEEYLEDQHDYHVAVDAYNEYIQNGRKGTPLEDVKKELDL